MSKAAPAKTDKAAVVPADVTDPAAVERLRESRRDDGTWLQGWKFGGETWVAHDVEPGEPSKWVTFLALRALDRWDAGTATPAHGTA